MELPMFFEASPLVIGLLLLLIGGLVIAVEGVRRGHRDRER
jgi:hypothetical protein